MKTISKGMIATAMALAFLAAPAYAAGAGDIVYIPLGSDGKVVVVDTHQDKIIGEIGDLPAVHGLAGTPDGQFLVAGSFDERAAGEGAPAKPAEISEDEHAAHHSAAPDGAKKADAMVSTVSVVRSADGAVMRRIDVPGAVHHVAVSPNGKFAVVTHPNEGTISAIDLSSYKVVATVATGPLPNYAAFSPDSGRLYVSNAGNDTVSAVDTGRWIVRWNTVVGSSPEHVVLSKDGATLYVNNVEDGTVSVLAVDGQKVVKTVPVGSTIHGIDLSDDGKTLYVAALGDDKLISVDLATATQRSTVLAPDPYHLATIRAAGKLYVSSAGESKVWVIDQQTLKVIGEIAVGGKGHQMVQGASG